MSSVSAELLARASPWASRNDRPVSLVLVGLHLSSILGVRHPDSLDSALSIDLHLLIALVKVFDLQVKVVCRSE